MTVKRFMYTQERLQEALSSVLGDSFQYMKEDCGDTLPEIAEDAALTLLTDNWSLHFDTPKIIIQALKDLKNHGCFKFADKEK